MVHGITYWYIRNGGRVLRILDVTQRLSFHWIQDANGNAKTEFELKELGFTVGII